MRAENGKLWGTLHDGKFEVRSLTEEDLVEALNILDDAFWVGESVCIACEIDLPQNEQARQELRELSRITAYDGYSLVIKHVESGRLVSVAFNKLQFAPPSGEEAFFIKFRNEQALSPQARRLMDYMISMDETVDVFGLYKLESVCELMYLGTLPEFGRLGLGRALVEYTVQLTREFGQGQGLEDVPLELRDKRPGAVTALWTSNYSQKIGKDVGFEVLNTVPYTKFEYNGKRFDERIGPLHKAGQLVIYKL